MAIDDRFFEHDGHVHAVINAPPIKYIDSYSGPLLINVHDLRKLGGRSCANAVAWLTRLADLPLSTCPHTNFAVRTPLVASAWAEALISSDYPYADAAALLVASIRRGVHIGYYGERRGVHAGRNQQSADENAQAVAKNIADEIALGRRLGPFDTPPFHFFRSNPLGVVFKRKDADHVKPRIVHNLSWPRRGDSVNKYVRKFSTKLDAFDKAVAMLAELGTGAFMAKIDIEAAYRCIPIAPADWPLFGLRWDTKFYFDPVMQFGSASATAIFEWFSTAAEFIAMKMLLIRSIVHYVDDFMILNKSRDECMRQLQALLALFKRLGLPVSPSKIEEPAQLMILLGILFNSITMTISLDEARVKDILALLLLWEHKQTASREELQSLTGLLNFAAHVVPTSRVFLRRMIAQLKLIPSEARSDEQFPLYADFFLDVRWWSNFLVPYNGKQVSRYISSRPFLHVYTDACVQGYAAIATGAQYAVDGSESEADVAQSRYYAMTWTEREECESQRRERDSMPWKELYAVARAVATFAPHLHGKQCILHCDCEPVVKAWNKGNSKQEGMTELLRTLLFICATDDIELQIVFLPGKSNELADVLSRGQIVRFRDCLKGHSRSEITCLPLPTLTW